MKDTTQITEALREWGELLVTRIRQETGGHQVAVAPQGPGLEILVDGVPSQRAEELLEEELAKTYSLHRATALTAMELFLAS